MARSLEFWSALVDEIVVVDTGSTDGTIEIARSFDALIERCPIKDDFSIPRNRSLDLASGDWILTFDPDEEMDPEDALELREMLSESVHDLYQLPRYNYYRNGNWFMDAPVRVFRRIPDIRYRGKIHEIPQGENVRSALLSAALHHFGWCRPTEVLERKRTLYMRSNPGESDGSATEFSRLFQIARLEYDGGDAKAALLRCDHLASLTERPILENLLLVFKGNVIRSMGDLEGSAECLRRAIEVHDGMYPAYEYMAATCIEMGQPERALENWKEAIVKAEKCRQLVAHHYVNAAWGCRRLGRTADTGMYLDEAFKLNRRLDRLERHERDEWCGCMGFPALIDVEGQLDMLENRYAESDNA